jgi:hypothetical protein
MSREEHYFYYLDNPNIIYKILYMVRNERLNVTVCYALYEQIIQGVQLNA